MASLSLHSLRSLKESLLDVDEIIEEEKVDDSAGTAPMLSSVVGLFKCIVGAGTLAIPASLASFTDEKSMVSVGALIAAVLAAMSAYTFYSVGQLSLKTNVKSLAEVLAATRGPKWLKISQILVAFKTGAACIGYAIIIANVGDDLAHSIDLHPSKVLGFGNDRSILLAATSLMVLLPLGFLRSLKALTPCAAIGLASVLFMILFMFVRLVDGTYEAPDGVYFKLDSRHQKPEFEIKGTGLFPGCLGLISILALSYNAHFNAPAFARELVDPTPKRCAFLTALGFSLACLANVTVMAIGFITFGGHAESVILSNYYKGDYLAIIARGGTMASVIGMFPFFMMSCKRNLLQLLFRPRDAPKDWQALLSAERITIVVFLILVTAAGMVIHSLGLFMALVGSVLATMIVYIFPALAYLGYVSPKLRQGEASSGEKLHHKVNILILVLGICIAVLGFGNTVRKVFAQ